MAGRTDDRDADFTAAAGANDAERGRAADARVRDQPVQQRYVRDVGAVEADDDVTGFEAGTVAKQSAQTLIEQGADVILPVGGPIYQSAAEAIRDSGDEIVLIGADSDTYETDSANSDLFLTSVLKGIKQATDDVTSQAASGDFTNEPYVGTLENDGVGIAPFHEFEDKVSESLQAELDEVKAGIIDGSIKVTSYLNQ